MSEKQVAVTLAPDSRNTLSPVNSIANEEQKKPQQGASEVTIAQTKDEGTKSEIKKVNSDDEEWEVDPDNPRNWSAVKKWTAMIIVSSAALWHHA